MEETLRHKAQFVEVYKTTAHTAAKRKELVYKKAALLEDELRVVNRRQQLAVRRQKNEARLAVHCNAVAVRTPPASTKAGRVVEQPGPKRPRCTKHQDLLQAVYLMTLHPLPQPKQSAMALSGSHRFLL